MISRLIVAAAATALCACQSPADIAAAHARADHAECVRLGAVPDTPAYADCREALAKVHAAERKRRTIALLRDMQRQPFYTPVIISPPP